MGLKGRFRKIMALSIAAAMAVCCPAGLTEYAGMAAKVQAEAEVDLEFYEENGGIVVTLYNDYTDHPVIPSVIEGKPVTVIRARYGGQQSAVAFGIKSVVIPEGVVEIGSYAFKNSTLEKVTLPSTLKKIGAYAFSGCESLKSVEIPEGVEDISSSFAGCTSLKEISLPSTLQNNINFSLGSGCNQLEIIRLNSANPYFTLQDGVLYDKDMTKIIHYPAMKKGTYYQMPSTVTDITRGVFWNQNVTDIEISRNFRFDTLQSPEAFGGPNLKNITVDASNPNLTVENGILFSKDKSVLMKYPPAREGTTYTIPSFVNKIRRGAFDSSKLTDLMVPGTVKELEGDALAGAQFRNVVFAKGLTRLPSFTFEYCRKLESVTLPETLEEIGEYAFAGCNSLTGIAFPATIRAVEFGAFAGCQEIKKIAIPSAVKDVNALNLDFHTFHDDCAIYCDPGSAAAQYAAEKGIPTKPYSEYFIVDNNTGNGNQKPAPSPNPGDTEKVQWAKGAKKKISGNTYTNLGDGTVSYTAPAGKSVKSVTVPSSVKQGGQSYAVSQISANAFKGCKKLSKVTVGVKVKQIGANAFSGCKKLKTITVKSKVLKKVGGKAFKGIHKKAKIKVPKAKLKAYKKLFKGKGQAKSVKIT